MSDEKVFPLFDKNKHVIVDDKDQLLGKMKLDENAVRVERIWQKDTAELVERIKDEGKLQALLQIVHFIQSIDPRILSHIRVSQDELIHQDTLVRWWNKRSDIIKEVDKLYSMIHMKNSELAVDCILNPLNSLVKLLAND